MTETGRRRNLSARHRFSQRKSARAGTVWGRIYDGYRLEGDLLEVCDCNILCPCWVGEDPDTGTCRSALAYSIVKGEDPGRRDVSGLVMGVAAFIPGNTLKGNFRVIRYIDDRASPAQEKALLAAFRGIWRTFGAARSPGRRGAEAKDRNRPWPRRARSRPMTLVFLPLFGGLIVLA